MKRLTFVLPAIAMLAACNSQPTVKAENASVADVAAAAKDAVKLEPGKWETSMQVLSVEGPGLPPQMAAQMKSAKIQKVETCLTKEQADQPPLGMFGAAKNCTYEKFEMGGGRLEGSLVCKEMPGMPKADMRAKMSGNFASSSYDLTTESTMTMPAMPGGPAGGGTVTTKTQISGKRIGECDVPKS